MLRFLLFFPFILAYADPYSVVIKGPFKDVVFDITQDYSRELSAVGFSQYYAQTPPSQTTYSDAFEYLSALNANRGEQIHLVRLDNDAAVSFEFSNNLAQFNRAVSMTKSVEDGYFLGGYTQEGQLLLLKLSHNGSVRFIRTFGTKNNDRLNRIIALRDGGVLCVGSSMTSRTPFNNMYEQGLGLNDIYLVRFDAYGNKKWSKKYGTLVDDQGIDAAEAYDGTLLILANSSEGNTRGVTLMRLSEEGDKIWLKRYNRDGVINAHRLIALHDRHFLAAISFYDDTHREQSRLLKFDLQRNLLFEHNISTDSTNVINDIKERANGAIIAAGQTTNALKTRAYAAAFDATLQPLWQRRFDQFERSRFHALTLLDNGDIALAGEVIESASENTDMWIVKLHRDGTQANTPFSTDSLYSKLCDTFKEEIAANLISISDTLEIELVGDALLFEVGVSDLTSAQKEFLDRFAPRLLALLGTETLNGLHVNGHTSSEWYSAKNTTERYLNNVKLATKRAYNVLEHLYQHNPKHQQWLETMLSNDAYNYRKKIMNQEKEDREKSRRISFSIEGVGK